MSIQKESRATGRGLQSFLFVQSLYRSVDALESKRASTSARVMKMAQEYAESGCDKDEIVELLYLDGIGPETARACVDNLDGISCKASVNQEEEGIWDFSFEDAAGRMWRGSDFGHSVVASNKEEAIRKASSILSLTEDSLETVIDAEKIG